MRDGSEGLVLDPGGASQHRYRRTICGAYCTLNDAPPSVLQFSARIQPSAFPPAQTYDRRPQ